MIAAADNPPAAPDPDFKLAPTGAYPAGRVYRGRSIEELIPGIEADLGPDAIILGRRAGLTGGFAGFFARPFVEIEARSGRPGIDVYDEQPSPRSVPLPPPQQQPASVPLPPPQQQPASLPLSRSRQPPPPGTSPALQPPPPGPSSAHRPPPDREPTIARAKFGTYVTDGLAALSGSGAVKPGTDPTASSFAAVLHSAQTAAASGPPNGSTNGVSNGSTNGVTPKISSNGSTNGVSNGSTNGSTHRAAPEISSNGAPEISSNGFTRESLPAGARPRTAKTAGAGPTSRVRSSISTPGVSASVSRGQTEESIERRLRELGVSQAFARELIDVALAHVLPLDPAGGLEHAVRKTLQQRIPVRPPLTTQGAAIALVGPGGSGKTTCCVALVNAYRSSSILRSSYVTVIASPAGDSLRVMLSPQVPMPTPVDTPRALGAIVGARDGGVAIIDSPPLSPADRPAIRAFARMLGEVKPDRVVLALPATLGAIAASQLLHALRPLGTDALAITHADETDQIGVAVEVACKFGIAPEYLLDDTRSSTGLTRIDPSCLADRLMP